MAGFVKICEMEVTKTYIGIIDKFEIDPAPQKGQSQSNFDRNIYVEIHAILQQDIEYFASGKKQVAHHFFYISIEHLEKGTFIDFLDVFHLTREYYPYFRYELIDPFNEDILQYLPPFGLSDFEGRLVVFKDNGFFEAMKTVIDENSSGGSILISQPESEPTPVKLSPANVSHREVYSFLKSLKDFSSTIEFKPEVIPDGKSSEVNSNLIFCVANVGQGSLNVLVDSDNNPVVYIDLGGGYGPNARTYPAYFNPSINENQQVFISHLDRDHVETLRRNLSAFAERNTMATIPEQSFSPFYKTLFESFKNSGGILYKLPRVASPIEINGLKYGYCTGNHSDKNNSGLYFYVVDKHNNLIAYPADAEPRYVPNLLENEFNYIIAPHHGANLKSQHGIPSRELKVIYSFGYDNSYRHPRQEQVTEYREKNWIHEASTNISGVFPLLTCLGDIAIGEQSIYITDGTTRVEFNSIF